MSARFFYSIFKVCLGLAVLLLCNPWTALAQMTSQGTVNVIVFDQQGSIVQGAQLEITDLATGRSRAGNSEQSGSFSFVTLPIGTYRLTVSKDGFKAYIVDKVTVEGGRTTDLKVIMEVGQVIQKVVVESGAPLLETTSNAMATTLDLKQIEDLPLQGRDISSLAFLTSGFSGVPGAGGGTWDGLPMIAQGNSIDGIMSSTSRMKFGGNVQPGLEARLETLDEMTVQTSQTDLNQGLGTSSM